MVYELFDIIEIMMDEVHWEDPVLFPGHITDPPEFPELPLYPVSNRGSELDQSGWHLQEAPNSCAIACQTDILNSFGINVSEGQIAKLAEDRGWYDPAIGTPPQALGYVLEAYGIPVTQNYDTSLTTLKDTLDNGEKVMVGLDANEIWAPDKDFSGNPLEQPDAGHAVWVTGIEMKPNGELEVILNDTGQVQGRGARIAMDDFVNAWDDFGRYAAVTDINSGGTHVS